MVVGVDQVTPMHFHRNTVEDIINRGGGKLVIQLYNATTDSAVTVSIDGVKRVVKAADQVLPSSGESIILPPRLYHRFGGAQERVLVGKVSLMNDDQSDNRFYESVGRFPEIEENEPPLHLLATDYARTSTRSNEPEPPRALELGRQCGIFQPCNSPPDRH
jgi:D-lyxose ketol-isomerase